MVQNKYGLIRETRDSESQTESDSENDEEYEPNGSFSLAIESEQPKSQEYSLGKSQGQ